MRVSVGPHFAPGGVQSRLRTVEPLLAHSEREWILIGMAECCAAKGYEATTVADVCDAAGVSRRSFGRVFADKDECLGATMESIVRLAWRALDVVNSSGKPWADALRDGAAVLLRAFAEHPAFAHVALLEAPLAGGQAEALHGSARASLLDFLDRGRGQAGTEIPASAARGALAGAEALLAARLRGGKAGQLGELAPDIAYMLAVPFLGVGEASRLARGAARRRHLRAVA
jgi:AcrR family transcriptional regulator